MPIEGRHLRDVSQAFRTHLNVLFSHTITRTPLIAFFVRGTNLVQLSFRQGGVPIGVTLSSTFGPVDLYLGQVCDAVEGQQDRVRLRTIKYQYTLTPIGASEPLLRWEYDKVPPASSYRCRHHLQGPLPIELGGAQPPTLNDLHLPTGWVTIEEVIRFCIVDLGVMPLDSAVGDDDVPAWHVRLQESYERFTTEFATLGEA